VNTGSCVFAVEELQKKTYCNKALWVSKEYAADLSVMDNQAEQTIYKWVETPTDWYVYGIRTVRVADTTLLIPAINRIDLKPGWCD